MSYNAQPPIVVAEVKFQLLITSIIDDFNKFLHKVESHPALIGTINGNSTSKISILGVRNW